MDGPAETEYFPDGKTKAEYWWRDGKQHRVGGPAAIYRHKNGAIESEFWIRDGVEESDGDTPSCRTYREDGTLGYERWSRQGKPYRENAPAEVVYARNGQPIEEEYWGYSPDGESCKTRENGKPAVVEYNPQGEIIRQVWFENGQKTRVEHGPGSVEPQHFVMVKRGNGKPQNESWIDFRGRLHRVEGPAKINRDNRGRVICEEWAFLGETHRAGAPAKTTYYANKQPKSEEYWQDGRRHRTDGPAVIEYDQDGNITCVEHWVNGVKTSLDGNPAVIE